MAYLTEKSTACISSSVFGNPFGSGELKLSLKQGQYVNIGDNIRVVYVGGSGNHARLLIDAPRELNIARSTTEENPARKKETYYAEPGISREAQQEIKRILWNERMKAEAKKDAESLKDKFNA